MSYYARYTEYSYDPARTEEVINFWRDPETTRPQGQPGFHAGYVLNSDEEPGRLRIVTLWQNEESFNTYFATPGHAGIGPKLEALSVINSARDGLYSTLELEQPAGHVRIIRAKIHSADDIAHVREFWQTQGRAVLESAAQRARAYIDEAQLLFVVQLWWDSAEQADAFVASEAHRVSFEEPLSVWVQKLDRIEGTPLD